MKYNLILLILFIIIVLLFLTPISNKDNYISSSSKTYSFDSILDYNVYFILENDLNSIYDQEIQDLIINSKNNIYCSIYNITLESISSELIKKKQEGLDIKIITDLKQSSNRNSVIGVLKSNDILVYTNLDPNKTMHNKFCVFDNTKVLFGSANFTYNSLYKNNNNFLVINNKEVNEIFTNQFNLFLNNSYATNINYSKRSLYEFYFCNSKTSVCKNKIIDLFKNSNKSVKCMSYSLTNNDVYLEIKELLDLNKDFELKFITEKRQNSKYSLYSKICNLSKNENKNFIIFDRNPNSMHNKFCVFDNNVLLTGSANITNNGLTNNYESILITKDQNLIEYYDLYFEKYFNMWK